MVNRCACPPLYTPRSIEAVGDPRQVRRRAALRDRDEVVLEGSARRPRQQERRAPPSACGRVLQRTRPMRFVQLPVQVIDPELIEVAQDDVLRPIGNQIDPVLERLLIVPTQSLAGLLLRSNPRTPHQVGERNVAAGTTPHPYLELAARLDDADVPECPEQPFEKHLGLAFLVAGKVTSAELDKASETLRKVVHGYIGVIHVDPVVGTHATYQLVLGRLTRYQSSAHTERIAINRRLQTL